MGVVDNTKNTWRPRSLSKEGAGGGGRGGHGVVLGLLNTTHCCKSVTARLDVDKAQVLWEILFCSRSLHKLVEPTSPLFESKRDEFIKLSKTGSSLQ